MDTFANCVFEKDNRPFEDIIIEAMDNLQEFENELNERKTTFFGGLYKSILFPISLLSIFLFFFLMLLIKHFYCKNCIFCFRKQSRYTGHSNMALVWARKGSDFTLQAACKSR